ncbi:MAG: cytochrome c oxidase subunit I [Phycisphaerales bacterium]|nr:cytochrome c oxidase subunit I [Phycisphaerales bacterium]
MTTAPESPRLALKAPPLSRLHEWVVTVDHKKLGLMYITSGLLFFIIGGLEATMMRWQLAWSDMGVVMPDEFNRLFTMHGTTMVFLVGMPILLGSANYLVPLMIGTRDLAFPRLNAFGFWLFLFGGLLLYFSYFGGQGLYGMGSAPDVGWFAYAPLTERTFSRGHSTDYWILGLLVSGFGSIATGINLVATILCMRCKGMSLMKMPIFVWIMLIDAILVVIAMPPLAASQVMLLFDRSLGAHFFDVQGGGSAVLWQNLFWFFGHPEVYILILPAFAFVSEIIPVFCRKVLFGYPLMVAATVAIGFISLGVWVHHMFAVGLSPAVNTAFMASTMLIAVPTGIKMFNWVATMYGGKIRLHTPMLFSLGFLVQFLFGGLTGIMLAVVPFDWQVSDSYFVVGHFHYVLFGGLVFTIFAAIYYWFPKVSGKMLSERIGKWHFWTLFIGFNLTFAPMHVSGMLGMPRRIYTYHADRGWEIWNLISSIGVLFQIIGVLFFAWNLLRSLKKGKPAGDDPWDAWTLEWSTPSPPPAWNFDVDPEVRSRRPLWDKKHPEDPDWKYE